MTGTCSRHQTAVTPHGEKLEIPGLQPVLVSEWLGVAARQRHHRLPEITLHKLRVGKARVDLRFWRDGEATRHEVLAVDGELEVEPRGTGLRKALV